MRMNPPKLTDWMRNPRINIYHSLNLTNNVDETLARRTVYDVVASGEELIIAQWCLRQLGRENVDI